MRNRTKQLLAILLTTTLLASSASVALADRDLTVGGTAVIAYTGGEPVHIRAGTGTDFASLGAAPPGAVVTIIAGPFESLDGTFWYGLRYRGTIGYIRADLLARADGLPETSASMPPPDSSGRSTATITGTAGDGARIRAEADIAAAIVIHAPEDTLVDVLGSPRAGDGYTWYPVGYLGLVGWVAGDFLRTGNTAAPVPPPGATPAVTPGAHARVSGTDGANLRVRATYGFDGAIVGYASPGAVIAILDGLFRDALGEDWYAIDHDGLSGYAAAAYLVWTSDALSPRSGPAPEPVPTVAPPAPARAPEGPPSPVAASASASRGQVLANAARRYLGSPYAWGGTAPGGFDCSGFTLYVANQALGYRLGRDTGAQLGAGTAVGARELQPGDLVFFVNTYQPGVSHVGIYLGGGEMIGAASERTGVAIANIWDSYWGPRFYAARRL